MAVGDAKSIRREQDLALAQANLYRTALEKAAYGDAGTQYGQGLDAITRYLAGAGPLADSGAPTALRYRLASQIYGGARNRINSGYAQYLAQLLSGASNFRYQQMMGQKKKSGVGSYIGAGLGTIGGALLGGPAGATAGYSIGSNY